MARVGLAIGLVLVGAACGSHDEPATTLAPDAAAPPAVAASAANSCELHTRFAGDEYCLPPPPKDKGFQLHIGPSNYDEPEPEFLLQPSAEVTTLFPAVSGNDKQVYFYHRQYRMRPGTHHNIVSALPKNGVDFPRRIAITNHLSEDNPKDGMLAPENAGVGIPLEPHAKLEVDVHSINTSDRPALREIWINFWYRDPKDVTEPVEELAAPGDTNLAIPPRADTMLGPYRCLVFGSGRMLWMYGHRHANNVRFSAWRLRGEQRLLLYEAYDWEDPLLLEFASNRQNPASDRARGIEGGYSGVLDLQQDDLLEWECHVINKTDGVLRFTNENFAGEMCILDAELVGANCF